MCYNLLMAASEKTAEKEFYEPIKEYLENAFIEKFGNCYLEVTANGLFSDTLKQVVRNDIIFTFLGRKASPDLTGFIHTKGSEWVTVFEGSGIVKDFITVEIKREKITLQDVYQAKMYGDLFQAKYALLISPKPIPGEIRRLDQRLFFVTYRYMNGWYLHVGEWDSEASRMQEYRWLPKSPYSID
jgi:hypothetical protein